MKNKITVTGANTVFFIFTVLFLLAQVVLLILSAVHGPDFIDNHMYPILLVNQYFLILIPVLFYLFIGRLNFKEVLRLKPPGVLPSLLIIACAIPAYFVASFINTFLMYFLQFLGDIPAQSIPVPKDVKELIIGLFIVALSPAICEEALHRGVMLKAYEKRGSVTAVVITAVIFGFFHFDITNLLGPIFLGLLIGYYVIRTNSIFAGMLAHFANNAIAEVIQYIFRFDIPSEKTITIPFGDLVNSAAWGAGGLVILVILLMCFRGATLGKYQPRPPIAGVREDIVSVISHWPMICVFVLYMLIALLSLFAIMASKLNLG